MKKPPDYHGPEGIRVPYGYIDVTSRTDPQGRRGIPGPEHPYYVVRNKISDTLKANGVRDSDALADKIMEDL